MAADFGFKPDVVGKEYYFISYNSEDSDRAGKYALALHNMGVPLWYDYGLKSGSTEWEEQIAEQIGECKALIMFITKMTFAQENTYVQNEYQLANDYGKKIYAVWLDNIDFEDVHRDLKSWFYDMRDLQGIDATDKSVDEAAWLIINDFNLRNMSNSQPPLSKCAPKGTLPKKKIIIPVIAAALMVVLVVAIVVGIAGNSAKNTNDISISESDNASDDSDTSNVYDSSQTNYSTYDIDDVSDISTLCIGDRIIFGTYEQDNDISNGAEDISWIVLAIEDDEALLITEYLLDCVPYSEGGWVIFWVDCTLRTWMNDTFYNAAFTSEEQEKIVVSTLVNDGQPTGVLEGCRDTDDKIFAMSIDEVKAYFANDDSRQAYATDFAKANGCYVDDELGTSYWWLRSPGDFIYYAANVNRSGGIDSDGLNVDFYTLTARPTCWVKL